MMRRTSALLGAGLVEYHEWHLHEPLLQNYEGWRILDNPKYETKADFLLDIVGCVRHLDPIIDDPRLTHKQRVCRLYRWALKELQMFLVQINAHKFNLAYKVVRARFEKYRYVTDPAMCDMMVRESQKYLREQACFHYMRRNPSSPWGTFCLANPMFHPDGTLVYDHFTHPDVMWYDDAKIHRWSSHHPMYGGAGEMSERFGDWDVSKHYYYMIWVFCSVFMGYTMLHSVGYWSVDNDRRFGDWSKQFNGTTIAAMRAEERKSRGKGASSALEHDWDRVLGIVKNEGRPSVKLYQ